MAGRLLSDKQASSARSQGLDLQAAANQATGVSSQKRSDWGVETLLNRMAEALGQAHMRLSDLAVQAEPILLNLEETVSEAPPLAQTWDPTPLNRALEERLNELDRLNQRLAYFSRRISL